MKRFKNEQGDSTERKTIGDYIMEIGIRGQLFRNPENRTRIIEVLGYTEGSNTGHIDVRLHQVKGLARAYSNTVEVTNFDSIREEYPVQATDREIGLLKEGALISLLTPE